VAVRQLPRQTRRGSRADHLDGSSCFASLQPDEGSLPIVLAWQLGRFDAATWAKVKLSADFLPSRGPSTPQERWEEDGG
jgi:glucoamylase